MTSQNSLAKLSQSDFAILTVLAALKFLLPFLAHGDFELHRDEFLYLAMGAHLDWGYLDVPPAIAVVARFTHELLGDSLFAVRFFPSLAGALIVFLTGLMARELGGGRFAQILAAIAVIMSPAYLRSSALFQPVVFDQFYFALGAYLTIRILKQERPRLWLALGVIAGVGLLNKYTMLLFGVGLLFGLLLTPQRRILVTQWPWLAAGIAFVLVTPNLIWQHRHGWPLFEHLAKLSQSQLAHVDPLGFLLMQLLMSFLAFPIWMMGLYFYLFGEAGRPYRAFGWMYLVILAILLFFSGKAYYLLPAYPMLFAAGALALEQTLARSRQVWLKPAIVTLIIVGNSIGFPYGIPVFSINGLQSYAKFMAENMGMVEPLRWETGKLHSIPQDFADMLGWENQVAAVSRVFQSLPPDEQEKCVILASNYGEAGAIDYYGRKYGLPKAISYHGSYYLWGPGEKTGEVMIAVGVDCEDLQPYFESVEQAATIAHEFARESNVPVCLCRNPKLTLQEFWPQLAGMRF